MKRLVLAALVSGSALMATSANAFSLAGTQFQAVGESKGIDPILIYSIALAESAYGKGRGSIAPWPWTLRTATTPYYESSQEEAAAVLNRIIQERGHKTSVDIGPMQVNLRWNGHRVNNPTDLLSFKTNIEVGTDILLEAIASAPGDLELGLGHYHHWESDVVARSYGRKILTIYEQLQLMSSDNRYASKHHN